MNAMEHGNKYQADLPVQIEVLATDNTVAVRITDQGGLTATPKPPARPAGKYNARAIERLFTGFASVKFYMTRDSLQEVLIRR